MSNSVEKILYRKAALIFEELGFLLPRAESSESDNSNYCSASVSFQGAFSGRLSVSLSPEVLADLAANMLGDDGRVGDAFEKDALRELSNVICGNALPAIYGAEKIFHLDAPEISDGNNSANDEARFTQAAQVNIGFDCGSAEIKLFVDNA
jgi:CheY-specific phosphatase CheX